MESWAVGLQSSDTTLSRTPKSVYCEVALNGRASRLHAENAEGNFACSPRGSWMRNDFNRIWFWRRVKPWQNEDTFWRQNNCWRKHVLVKQCCDSNRILDTHVSENLVLNICCVRVALGNVAMFCHGTGIGHSVAATMCRLDRRGLVTPTPGTNLSVDFANCSGVHSSGRCPWKNSSLLDQNGGFSE